MKNTHKINRLLLRIKNGDELALEDLYIITGKKLFCFIFQYTHNRYITEDLLQDTFIKLMKSVKNFTSKGSGWSWMLTIAKSIINNYYTRDKNKDNLNIDDCYNICDKDNDMNFALVYAIDKLPKLERKLIISKYYEDKTIREISAEYNIPKSTVSDRIITAEALLKANMED